MYLIIGSNLNTSGVESISYNFQLPILVPKVGQFPITVKHTFNGYLAKVNNIDSMAEAMLRYIDNPLLGENIKANKQNMRRSNFVEAILNRDF